MKESKHDTIRNVAVLSYGGAGKTTLIEAFLCSSGTIPQMGSVAAGTTAMDYDPEEHHRKVSIQTSLCQISWNDKTEEHTSELQSRSDLVCRLLLEKK